MRIIKKPKANRLKNYLIPAMLIATGLVLSGVIFYMVREWEKERLHIQFANNTEVRISLLRLRIEQCLNELNALGRFYEGSQFVEKNEFKAFVLPVLSKYPEIEAFEWLQYITDSANNVNCCVYYIEPEQDKKKFLGFDLSTVPECLAAMDKARDTGKAAATGRIPVTEGAEEFGFYTLYPLYDHKVAVDTLEERRKNIVGFVAGFFNAKASLDAAISSTPPVGVDTEVLDRSAHAENQFLYFHIARLRKDRSMDAQTIRQKNKGNLCYSKSFEVADRLWEVVCRPAPEFIASHRSITSLVIFFVCLFLTGILTVYSITSRQQNARVNALVDQRTSELEKQQKLLKRTVKNLERRNKELDEFTYIASHDLQEPLRKITSFSGLLKKDAGDNLPKRALKDLDFITDSAERMKSLIQALLSLSRSGRKVMKQENFPLSDCVDAALSALTPHLKETGAKIIRDNLPEVWGDRTLLTQIYQNLIGNALKFTSNKRPVIHITAEVLNGKTIFGVKDNGIGIKPEYFKQIFIPFERLHGRGKYKGTGIGLAVCRRVVDRHNGRIWVESEPGKGAHFKYAIKEQKEREQ